MKNMAKEATAVYDNVALDVDAVVDEAASGNEAVAVEVDVDDVVDVGEVVDEAVALDGRAVAVALDGD